MNIISNKAVKEGILYLPSLPYLIIVHNCTKYNSSVCSAIKNCAVCTGNALMYDVLLDALF